MEFELGYESLPEPTNLSQTGTDAIYDVSLYEMIIRWNFRSFTFLVTLFYYLNERDHTQIVSYFVIFINFDSSSGLCLVPDDMSSLLDSLIAKLACALS